MYPLCIARIQWQFDGFSEWNSAGSLSLIAIVAAIVAVTVGGAVVRQPWATRKQAPSLSAFSARSPTLEPEQQQRAGFYQEKSKRELRRWMRRAGSSIEVLVKPMTANVQPVSARVVDRSRGGIQIEADFAVKVGEPFLVRAVNAPEEQDWVPIQIRHCRRKDDRWLWGCKFMREMPWGELLLFG